MRIRKAKLIDVPSIFIIETCCFRHMEEIFDMSQIADLIRNHIVLVVEEDNTVVGWGAAIRRKNTPTGRIDAVAILPLMQGRGYGKKLVQALLNKLSGLERVYLFVRQDNPAMGLYSSFGFKKVRWMKDYYKKGVHAFRMILRFTS